MNLNRYLSFNSSILLAVAVAIFCGYLHQPVIYSAATIISDIFMNLLRLVSIPIIFLALVSTISGMENVVEFKTLGKKVVKYTLLTTWIAAFLALMIFFVLDPVSVQKVSEGANPAVSQKGYLNYLLQAIPSNIIHPFSENHVIGVLVLAILFSLATLALPDHNRSFLHNLFSSLYAMVMKVTSWIIQWIPLAIWGFVTLFIRDMRDGLELKSLAVYLACVLTANLIQGLIVLPSFVKFHGISPVKLFKGMLPALSVAFFSKSSSATLPMAMCCGVDKVGMSKKVTNFTFPFCTTINMNACAAFILITVLFVSMSSGMVYSYWEMFLWTFVATVAALGNAGVPMGCYFLSSAILASMNVPLHLMGVILPFYAMIDMLETALNVWSDSCVVAVVDKQATKITPVPSNPKDVAALYLNPQYDKVKINQ